MIELVDNLIQLAVTVSGCISSAILFSRHRRQPFFLLACFYGTNALGCLYWALHVLLLRQTPQIFYVSDLGWVASFLFLLTLELTLPSDAERQSHTPLCCLVPTICVPQFLLYITHGDVLFNILMCGITMFIAWYSVRGLVYAIRQKNRTLRAFHITALCFVGLEYALWTFSCFWISDTLTNPYFWCDFLLSVTLLFFIPSVRKAVES